MTKRKLLFERLSIGMRALVSLLLVAWILDAIDVMESLKILGSAQFPWLAAAVVSMLGMHGANCLRWCWCLFGDSKRVRLRAVLFSYWTSLFVGLALPTEYGGDLLRVKDINDRLKSRTIAMGSVLWSRMSGIGATVLIFSFVGLLRFDKLVELSMVSVWVVSVVAWIATMLVIFVLPIRETLWRLFESVSTILPPVLKRLYNSLLQISPRAGSRAMTRNDVCRIAFVSVVSQVLLICANCFYSWALGQNVEFTDMALVVPLVTLSTLLPVSIAGIGVKEGVFVILLSALGVSHEGALSVALLKRLVLLLLALTGGCLYPFRQRLMGD